MLPCCATSQVPRKYWRGNVVINIHVTDGTPAQVELELRGTEPGKGLGCRCFGEPHGDVKQHRLAQSQRPKKQMVRTSFSVCGIGSHFIC